MKRFFVFLLMQISLFSVAFSQELIVKSLKVSEGDISAQIQPRLDTNDRNCALIKVGLTLDDVQFDGNLMGKVEHKIGEYWVYMPQGNSMLRILHKDYTYIDEFGKKLINSEFYFSNDKAKELFSSGFRKPFSEGFGLIMKNGKWGLIDRFGNTTFDYL